MGVSKERRSSRNIRFVIGADGEHPLINDHGGGNLPREIRSRLLVFYTLERHSIDGVRFRVPRPEQSLKPGQGL